MLGGMYAAVTITRAPDGRVLARSEWQPPLIGELRFSQYHSPSQPNSRAVLEADLYADWGLSSARDLAHLSDVVIMPDPDGHLGIGGIIRETKGGQLYEHRQIWICVPMPEPNL